MEERGGRRPARTGLHGHLCLVRRVHAATVLSCAGKASAGRREEHREQCRERHRSDPRVLEQLERWWRAVKVHVEDDNDDDDVLDKKEYADLHSRLVKAFNSDDDDSNDLSDAHAKEALEEDWDRDSKGDGSVDKADTYDSLFELAHVWCDSDALDAYVEFLEDLYSKVFGGADRWRRIKIASFDASRFKNFNAQHDGSASRAEDGASGGDSAGTGTRTTGEKNTEREQAGDAPKRNAGRTFVPELGASTAGPDAKTAVPSEGGTSVAQLLFARGATGKRRNTLDQALYGLAAPEPCAPEPAPNPKGAPAHGDDREHGEIGESLEASAGAAHARRSGARISDFGIGSTQFSTKLKQLRDALPPRCTKPIHVPTPNHSIIASRFHTGQCGTARHTQPALARARFVGRCATLGCVKHCAGPTVMYCSVCLRLRGPGAEPRRRAPRRPLSAPRYKVPREALAAAQKRRGARESDAARAGASTTVSSRGHVFSFDTARCEREREQAESQALKPETGLGLTGVATAERHSTQLVRVRGSASSSASAALVHTRRCVGVDGAMVRHRLVQRRDGYSGKSTQQRPPARLTSAGSRISREQSSTSQSDAAGLDAPRSIVSALTPFSPTTPNASVFSCASTEVLGLWRERAKEHAEMSALLSQVPETETDASPAGQQRSATERKPGRSTTHAQESPPARETPRTVATAVVPQPVKSPEGCHVAADSGADANGVTHVDVNEGESIPEPEPCQPAVAAGTQNMPNPVPATSADAEPVYSLPHLIGLAEWDAGQQQKKTRTQDRKEAQQSQMQHSAAPATESGAGEKLLFSAAACAVQSGTLERFMPDGLRQGARRWRGARMGGSGAALMMSARARNSAEGQESGAQGAVRGKRRRRARPQSAAVAQPRQPRAAVRASLTTRDQRAPARGRERPLTASASRKARSTRARRVAMIQQHHDGCGDGASPEPKGWKDQADARAFDDADVDDMNMNAEDDTWFGGEEAALFQQFESRLPAS